MFRSACICVILLFSTAVISFSDEVPDIKLTETFDKPTVTHFGLVDRDIMCVEINNNGFIPARQEPYVKQEGDELIVKKKVSNGDIKSMVLKRGGKEIGGIAGKNNDIFCHPSDNRCPRLDTDIADRTSTWLVSSEDDEAFTGGKQPVSVSRKTKPMNWVETDRLMKSPLHHFIYLKLPVQLTAGKSYTLNIKGLNTSQSEYVFTFNPAVIRSEAVHVNQVGFRPDDPAKRAYLSVWKGNGGAHSYGRDMTFAVIDSSGKRVYEGKVSKTFPASKQEYSNYGKNASKTDVHWMDFGDFTQQGTFRILVDGIGTSYPFEINDKAWLEALKVSMKGFYNQRSGIAQGPPYSDFRKDRDMHPDDGNKIWKTTFDVTSGSRGQGGVFKGLIAKKTDQTVTNAWGGYHDAGDWDRRIQHLNASYKQLELAELFPEKVKNLNLNIPESANSIPDIIDEALFNIDCYRRMQTPEGGIPHGIESSAHPRSGELSSQESLTIFVFAPDVMSSAEYAATAAKAAWVLRNIDEALSETYKASALKAMEYVEKNYPSWVADQDTKKSHGSGKNARNRAALELYRLTGDNKWHEIILQDTEISAMSLGKSGKVGGQGDAVFLYARLSEDLGKPELKEAAKQAITGTADESFVYGEGNGFNLYHPNKYMPRINGFFSVPNWPELVRAHYLTKDEKYLKALLLACNFGMGANPMNMPLTTGLGDNPARNPLHIDSRESGQQAPIGITLYGISDLAWQKDGWGGGWAFKWFFSKQCTPHGYDWPVAEDYFDVSGNPCQNEFTIMGPMEYAAYNWGYLALRD